MRKADRELWTRMADGIDAGVAARVLGLQPAAAPRKYRNRVTMRYGIRFASKLEADRYCELELERLGHRVAWFLRQVPFDVAPGVVYRADFLVVANPSGLVSVEDCKGVLTPTSRVKIAAVEHRYGIKIKLLHRQDVRRM